jgi:uncharacterized protein (DUF1778 family)
MSQTAKKLFQFRAPESLSDAIEVAAKLNCQSKAEFVRRSIIDRLHSVGIDHSQLAGAA